MAKTVSGKTPVFVRDATGLVRSLSWFDGVMFTLAFYNIAVACFMNFGWGSWLFPGADIGIAVGIVGFLIDIPMLIAYSFFAMGMPRSGGDYVYVSRGLSAPLGTGVAFVYMIFFAIFSYGYNGWMTVGLNLSPGLAVLGYNLNNPQLVSLASEVLQPGPTIAIGVVMLVAAFVITLLPTSALHKFLRILSPIALLGWPVIYIIMLASSSNAAFQASFNAYGAAFGTGYQEIIQSAVNSGATVAPYSLAASIGALPIVYATLAFPNQAVYTAGEIRRPMWAMPISLGVGILVICLSTWLMGVVTYNVFGFSFMQATAFYAFSGVPGYPLPAPPFTNLFFGILFNNAALNAFMLISAIVWELILMVSNAFVASRMIFALAFDRVIPASLSDVSERLHTPIKANIVALLGAIFFLLATVYAWLGTLVNSIVGWTSVFLIVMVTAILFPFVKKELFESFPASAKRRIGGVPAMSVAGMLGTVALLVVFYYLFNSPVVGMSTGALIGTGIVILAYALCAVWYYATRAYWKRQGIDLTLAFKEIPPE